MKLKEQDEIKSAVEKYDLNSFFGRFVQFRVREILRHLQKIL